MNEEEILDKEIDKKAGMRPLNWLFYLASFFLLTRFLFYWLNWPYSNYLLIAAGVCYEIFSLLRLLYYPDKTLFQSYSYVFFLLVIPGFIMDYMLWPGATLLLYAASAIPLIFFGHLAYSSFRKKK
jgi:hypothetical protein